MAGSYRKKAEEAIMDHQENLDMKLPGNQVDALGLRISIDVSISLDSIAAIIRYLEKAKGLMTIDKTESV